SHAIEELLLLRRELLFAEQALLAQLVQLTDLRWDRRLAVVDVGHRLAHAVELAVLVGLDLAVDLVLHSRRVAHVGERLPSGLARRLDDEVAGPDDPLEDRLA